MFSSLLILIFIRPFISSLAFPYLNTFYTAFLIILLVVWIITNGLPLKKLQPLKYPLILFVLSLIISTVFSANKINSIIELYKYLTGLLLFFIIVCMESKNKMLVIHTLVFAGLIISVSAIYQYLFGFRHVFQFLENNLTGSAFTLDYLQNQRVFFPFITPNILGGYLAMIAPLALINKKNNLFIVPFCITLFFTKSLGSFSSVVAGLLLYFLLLGKTDKRKTLSLAGLLIIIVFVFVLRTNIPKQHIQPLLSATMRINYWTDSFKIIKTHPLAGVGLGNFNLPQSRYAHNSYLQIWAETGIPGIVAFLWLMGSIVTWTRKQFLSKELSQGSRFLFISVLIFLIHNLVDFTFFLPEVSFIWWVILGLLYS